MVEGGADAPDPGPDPDPAPHSEPTPSTPPNRVVLVPANFDAPPPTPAGPAPPPGEPSPPGTAKTTGVVWVFGLIRRGYRWLRHQLQRIPRRARGVIMLVVVGTLFGVVISRELATARSSVARLEHVNLLLLLLALGLELVSLLAYAWLTHTVLQPQSPTRWRLLLINAASGGLSHVVPGGPAPGSALSYRLLGLEGVSGSAAAFGLGIQGVGSAVVLNLIFWLSLFVSIPLSGYNRLYGFAALVGVVLLAILGGVLVLFLGGKEEPADRILSLVDRLPWLSREKIAPRLQQVTDRLHELIEHQDLVRRAIGWAAANWLFDAASLWVFVFAFGKALNPIDLLVAYGLVNILAAIPLTPSGLGVVETVLIPTLVGFGTPSKVATLGVLSWRLVNFWLPIPTGGAAYLWLKLHPHTPAAGANQMAAAP